MDGYREIAVEAVITLGVFSDLVNERSDELIAKRVNTLAMKLGALDAERERERNGFGGRTTPVIVPLSCDGISPEQYDALDVAVKPARGRESEPDGREDAEPDREEPDGNVTVLPGMNIAPLPNEHPLDLKGSGRTGKPAARFRMREVGGAWKEGTAAELAKEFGCAPSQVYKWANGKPVSQNYYVERMQ